MPLFRRGNKDEGKTPPANEPSAADRDLMPPPPPAGGDDASYGQVAPIEAPSGPQWVGHQEQPKADDWSDGEEHFSAPSLQAAPAPAARQPEPEPEPEPEPQAPAMPNWDAPTQREPERRPEPVAAAAPAPRAEQRSEPQRPAPRVTNEPKRSDDEYEWHTYNITPSGKPDAVEFIEVHKAFGRNKILRGLNMGLPEGMISMILGPSGTGKSVCIKHMVGLLYPDEGDVLVHGESIPNMADDDLFETRKKFGVLFQDGALFGSMNLLDNVAFPLRQHTDKSEEEILDIVRRRLNEVGLGHSEDKFPNELSGGMRKRAGFARALVLDPDIVLFDEPDSGLDPVRTALLGELIQEIHADMMEEAEERGRQTLPCFSVITHDIMSARRVADYICVLWKGRIVEAGPSHQMLNSDNLFIRQFLSGESQGPLTMD